ncbi:DnaJ C-terminal domain-containing protein [Brevundimonas aurifodinae]|uniref:DnaJ C-terminal domain-containing protein n=2 Tax=Brevundimonas TaxID=41275 RepID=A0ABV1NQD4_9CAUL|nr:MAG: molecular chaperone DnaJ [Brevundimonas subvibrioides]
MSASGPSLSQAFAVLGLHGPADTVVVARAFRLAVKAARPDLPGGDDARFRRVIAAYRLIQSRGGARAALAAPVRRPAALPVVGLTPHQALKGGQATLRFCGRTLKVTVPPGMRTGEHLRLKGAGAGGGDLYLPILIRACEGLTVVGDDLHMTWPTSRRLLADGGRVEIHTPAGTRPAWITPGLTDPVRLRLRGLGLPARGKHGQGHLFVHLTPAEDPPSAAEDLLARFTRVWTPERLAA